VNRIVGSISPDGKVFCTNSIFVGMDLYKKYLQIALMNDNGKVIKNSKVDNSIGEISKFFDNINKRKEGQKKNKNNDNLRVVMESSCVWYNIYEYLTEERNLDVILSNPIKTKAIASAKIKTDKIDGGKIILT
jgi:transposase